MDDAIKLLLFKINNLESYQMLEGGKAATRKRLNCRFSVPHQDPGDQFLREIAGVLIASRENHL